MNSLRDNGLREYARLLEENGFTIYYPKSSRDYFTYSQMVNGQECFGHVQLDYFGGYSHYMPIKPSRENGSSMFVAGVPDELTIETAKKVAQPTNRNHLVGTQTQSP